MTGPTHPPETPEGPAADAAGGADADAPGPKKRSALREAALLVGIAVVIYWVMLTFIARPYLIPSESMQPTLHGCPGCTGDRVMVDKMTYRFTEPAPGDVVVFEGPPNWNIGYQSIRSDNPALRTVQDVLSFIGFVPPDQNDLVKRIIAVGGQTVECTTENGLTVDGQRLDEPYLDYATMNVPADNPYAACLGPEFGPVTVPADRLWMMGDNRTRSADSRAHYCTVFPDGPDSQCTGDPTAATVPVDNVIGIARFIAWPPGRWGGVPAQDPQVTQ